MARPDPPLDISTDQAFEEALTYWRERVPLDKREWAKLSERARQRAFTVAHVTQMDVLKALYEGIDAALADGETFADFRGRVESDFRGAWVDGKANRLADRVLPLLETVFINGVQTSYNAGRFRQMTHPDVLAARPYWAMDTVQDNRQSPICRRLNGVVKPANDPWFAQHWPPLHHRCRTSVITITADQIDAWGSLDAPDDDSVAPGFGKSPTGLAWQPEKANYPAPLWEAYTQNAEDDLP